MFKFFLDLDKVDKLVAPLPQADQQLQKACEEGDEVAVFLYVDQGADVNSVNDGGNRPLHVAAYNGSLPVVNFLVNRGADVNARGGAGNTALHYATKRNHARVVHFLLAHHADPNCVNEAGFSPLHIAASRPPHGNAGGAVDGECDGVLREFTRGTAIGGIPVDVDQEGPGGNTALHFAVSARNVGAVRALLGSGLVSTSRNAEGVSPLALAEALPDGAPFKDDIVASLQSSILTNCEWLDDGRNLGRDGAEQHAHSPEQNRHDEEAALWEGADSASEQMVDALIGDDKVLLNLAAPQTRNASSDVTEVDSSFPFRQFVATFHATENAANADSHLHGEVKRGAQLIDESITVEPRALDETAQEETGQSQPRSETGQGQHTDTLNSEGPLRAGSTPSSQSSDSESPRDEAAGSTSDNGRSESSADDHEMTDISDGNASEVHEDAHASVTIEWACDAREARTFPIVEDRCAVCHTKWGQYRCAETGDDVCSLECKAINIVRAKARTVNAGTEIAPGNSGPTVDDSAANGDMGESVAFADMRSINYASLSGPPTCVVCQNLALYQHSATGALLCSQACKTKHQDSVRELATPSSHHTVDLEAPKPDSEFAAYTQGKGVGLDATGRGSSREGRSSFATSLMANATRFVEKAKELDAAADGVWQRATARVASVASKARTAAKEASEVAAETAVRTDKCCVCGTLTQ